MKADILIQDGSQKQESSQNIYCLTANFQEWKQPTRLTENAVGYREMFPVSEILEVVLMLKLKLIIYFRIMIISCMN